MENLLKYYEFSNFRKDQSGTFSSQIAYSKLNSEHFLIFEKDKDSYSLYISKYINEEAIGKLKPEILESLVQDYDTSNSEHRIALRQYYKY